MTDNYPPVLRPIDVLFGRGALVARHFGNQLFRRIIWVHREEYLRCNKKERHVIAYRVMNLVHQLGGQFLKAVGEKPAPPLPRVRRHCGEVERYYTGPVALVTQARALEKVFQALRERSATPPKTPRLQEIVHSLLLTKSFGKDVRDVLLQCLTSAQEQEKAEAAEQQAQQGYITTKTVKLKKKTTISSADIEPWKQI